MNYINKYSHYLIKIITNYKDTYYQLFMYFYNLSRLMSQVYYLKNQIVILLDLLHYIDSAFIHSSSTLHGHMLYLMTPIYLLLHSHSLNPQLIVIYIGL